MFPTTIVFLFKSILCLLRHVRNKKCQKNVLLAGFLAGFISLF